MWVELGLPDQVPGGALEPQEGSEALRVPEMLRRHNKKRAGCGRHALQGISGEMTRDQLSIFSAAMKASCGMSTLPYWRIRFLPSFCLSRSLRLRDASPP